jgi:hypothetical protein
VLGFKDLGENEHKPDARTMVHYSPEYDETLEIVVHPFNDWLLPNPTHFSLEVDRDTFDDVLAAARELQVSVFADSACEATGCTEIDLRGEHYQRFVVVDPSGTRVEILTRSEPASSQNLNVR